MHNHPLRPFGVPSGPISSRRAVETLERFGIPFEVDRDGTLVCFNARIDVETLEIRGIREGCGISEPIGYLSTDERDEAASPFGIICRLVHVFEYLDPQGRAPAVVYAAHEQAERELLDMLKEARTPYYRDLPTTG